MYDSQQTAQGVSAPAVLIASWLSVIAGLLVFWVSGLAGWLSLLRQVSQAGFQACMWGQIVRVSGEKIDMTFLQAARCVCRSS